MARHPFVRETDGFALAAIGAHGHDTAGEALLLEPGSYRDRNGVVFYRDGGVFRGISAQALANWERLSAAPFFREFTALGSIVATALVIEFVGRDDAMVETLLRNRDDRYADYSLANFEHEPSNATQSRRSGCSRTASAGSILPCRSPTNACPGWAKASAEAGPLVRRSPIRGAAFGQPHHRLYRISGPWRAVLPRCLAAAGRDCVQPQ